MVRKYSSIFFLVLAKTASISAIVFVVSTVSNSKIHLCQLDKYRIFPGFLVEYQTIVYKFIFRLREAISF